MAISKDGRGFDSGCTELAKVHPESSDKVSKITIGSSNWCCCVQSSGFFCPRFFLYSLLFILGSYGFSLSYIFLCQSF